MGVKYRYFEIQNNCDSINAFGGLNFVSQCFDNPKISQLIDSHIINNSEGAIHSLRDPLKTLRLTIFAWGDRAKEINVLLCKL
jgi:hypothetical protein